MERRGKRPEVAGRHVGVHVGELGIVEVAEAGDVGDLVDAVVVRVDESGALSQRPGDPTTYDLVIAVISGVRVRTWTVAVSLSVRFSNGSRTVIVIV